MLLQGRDLWILDSSNKHLIAKAKSCDIDVECDEIEVSSPTTGVWRRFIAGRKHWTVTINYLVTAGQLSTDLLKVGTTVSLKMKDGNTGTALSGSAIIKTARVVGTVGNLTTGTFQLRGVGSLS